MTINNSFNNPSCSNFTLKAMARLGVFNARDQKGHEGSIVTEIKNEEVIFTTTSFTGRGCWFSWGFSYVHIHLQTAQFQKGRDEYLPIPLN